MKDQKQTDYTKSLIYERVKKQVETKVPIRKGCKNDGGCFCSGACQEIVAWRDKTAEELRQDAINLPPMY